MQFALAAFRFVRPMFRDPETRHIAYQTLKAATSVASNYRASCLARSPDEFVAKIGLVREESDESLFWLTFIRLAELALGRSSDLKTLTAEADELTRIFAASYHTSRENRARSRKAQRAKRAVNRSLDR